jgi:hypothetical protein
VNQLTVPGAVTLAGTLNRTGTRLQHTEPIALLIDSSTGPWDVSGVSLGTAATGFAYGVHVSGGDIFLDITENPIASTRWPRRRAPARGTVTWQHTVGATANDRLLIVGCPPETTTASALHLRHLRVPDPHGSRGDTRERRRTRLHSLARRVEPTPSRSPSRGTSCFVVAGSVSYTASTRRARRRHRQRGRGDRDRQYPSARDRDRPRQRGDKVFAVLSSNTANVRHSRSRRG